MVVQITLYQVKDQIWFIEWYLNLPLAPWCGGLFESLLKSLSDLLIKYLKGSRLSYEEMETVLFECEVISNNRQLTYKFPTDLLHT